LKYDWLIRTLITIKPEARRIAVNIAAGRSALSALAMAADAQDCLDPGKHRNPRRLVAREQLGRFMSPGQWLILQQNKQN
jgi:hypothetical protein